jgi:hypothetical protein
LANRCRPRCTAGANRPSAACEYEMNPLKDTARPP